MKKSAFALAAVLFASLAYAEVKSGLQVGEGVPAYNPTHIAGPDKGTKTCPV